MDLKQIENLAVIGMGYIGLPTALMFASHGMSTIGVDINPDLVDSLTQGKITFEENGLPELFERAKANIAFQTTVPVADCYIIAVPTPFDKHSKKIDPSYLIKSVQSVPRSDAIVIIESTVSPGTIDKYIRPITQNPLVHAPERVIPGNMINELMHNARVIGSDIPAVGEAVRDIYDRFCKSDIVLTSIQTAEMTKVVENTYRDINIAYANELAKICRIGGLNVYEIIQIANMHPRVNILQPGPGVGGHCISVDPWFLVGDYPQHSLLIREARKINDSMPSHVLSRVAEIAKAHGLHKPAVGFYGITYKEDVDDTRESPTMQLHELMEMTLGGDSVVYYDPMCTGVLPSQLDSFEDFVKQSDIVVIMAAHSHIKENRDKLANKLVLDTKHSGLDWAYGL